MARQYLEQFDKKYHYYPATLFEWLHQRSEIVLLILIGPVILFLVLANLDGYPTISGWDEGMYLQFASNLAYHGEYATRSGDTFNRLIPAGGTGPTLIVPVGLALWLSGDSLAPA